MVKDKIMGRIWKTSHVNYMNFELRGGTDNNLCVHVLPPARPEIYLHELNSFRTDIFENELKRLDNIV